MMPVRLLGAEPDVAHPRAHAVNLPPPPTKCSWPTPACAPRAEDRAGSLEIGVYVGVY